MIPAAKRNRPAFTLIELMVAVSILAIVIAITNMILAQSQKVVRNAEARMRAQSTVKALTHLIRRDMRELTKNGMLCITDDNSIPGYPTPMPKLILHKAGMAESLTYDGSVPAADTGLGGSGSLTTYALTWNYANPLGGVQGIDANTPCILWRRDLMLIQDGNYLQGDPNLKDYRVAPPELSGTRTDFMTLVNNNAWTSPSYSMRYPPSANQGGLDVAYLWQAASITCSRLSIMWTDGTIDNKALSWYGRDANGVLWPKRATWTTTTDAGQVEFKRSSTLNYYTALWSHHNQSGWPLAVKFRFSYREPSLPTEFLDDSADRNTYGNIMDFEIVCPVGR